MYVLIEHDNDLWLQHTTNGILPPLYTLPIEGFTLHQHYRRHYKVYPVNDNDRAIASAPITYMGWRVD